MALVYLDPSVLIRLCRGGEGAPLAQALWRGADCVVTARISEVQVRSALAGSADLASWQTFFPALALVELVGVVAQRAASLAEEGLVPLDAIQVASALTVQHEDSVTATWNPAVAVTLRAHGMRVVP